MANKPYDLRERSFLYACDIVAFTRRVAERDHVLRHLAWQLVDAGGSVGANLEEGVGGQTKRDFICQTVHSVERIARSAILAAIDRDLRTALQVQRAAADSGID